MHVYDFSNIRFFLGPKATSLEECQLQQVIIRETKTKTRLGDLQEEFQLPQVIAESSISPVRCLPFFLVYSSLVESHHFHSCPSAYILFLCYSSPVDFTLV